MHPAPTSARRDALLLVAICALAFALRVGAAAVFQGLDAPPDAGAQPDQLDYELLAHRLSEGEGYELEPGEPTALRTPGTSLALLPAYLAFGRSFAAGRLWFALLSALTCYAVARFTTRAFGARAGLLAALWLALYPGHFYYPMHFLSEVPYGLFLALAALAALRAAKARSGAWAFAAGIALGLATLTRPQALLVVPIALALAFVFHARAWRLLAVGVASFALCLAPWVARNAVVMGKASLSSVGGGTFWGAHNERVLYDAELRGYWTEITGLVDDAHPLEGGEFEQEAQAWGYGLDFVRAHAREMPGLVAAKLQRFLTPFEPVPNPLAYWAFALGWLVGAPLALAGLALGWRRDRAATLIVLAQVLATFATVVVFYGSGRFRDSMAAVLAVPTGLALDRLLRALGARRRDR